MKATARGVGESPVMEPRNTNTSLHQNTRDCHQIQSPESPTLALDYLDESLFQTLTWVFQASAMQ